jgi:hypothetical protein
MKWEKTTRKFFFNLIYLYLGNWIGIFLIRHFLYFQSAFKRRMLTNNSSCWFNLIVWTGRWKKFFNFSFRSATPTNTEIYHLRPHFSESTFNLDNPECWLMYLHWKRWQMNQGSTKSQENDYNLNQVNFHLIGN